jgi:hypothetical protein
MVYLKTRKPGGFLGTGPVNCLKLMHRHLFTCADDCTIKIWRQRASDPQQSAQLSTFGSKALSLCTLDTATRGAVAGGKAPVGNITSGLHAVVGCDDGSLYALPFQLKQQWLQGAAWRPKVVVKVFDRVPITAVAFEYRNVYCGAATGAIAVYRLITGSEDLASLDELARNLEQLGFGTDASAIQKARRSEAGSKLVQELGQVVRLAPLFTLSAHASAAKGSATHKGHSKKACF